MAYAMIGVGAVELLVALRCIYTKNQSKAVLWVAWLSTLFGIYRVGAWWLGVTAPRPCLGTAYEWFPWLARHGNSLTLLAFAFLLLGSYSLLVRKFFLR